MIVISLNTTDRASIRQKLLGNGYREQFLNEMNAGEFLYFNINTRDRSFVTMKHDDYKMEYQFQINREALFVMSSYIFRERFTLLI